MLFVPKLYPDGNDTPQVKRTRSKLNIRKLQIHCTQQARTQALHLQFMRLLKLQYIGKIINDLLTVCLKTKK